MVASWINGTRNCDTSFGTDISMQKQQNICNTTYMIRLLWNLELMWITQHIICWHGILLKSIKL